MDYDLFVSQVMNSDLEDWIYDEELIRFTLYSNLGISILQMESEPKRCEEKWVAKFSDPVAYSKDYLLCYNGSPLRKVKTVAVDGNRMYIPLPSQGDLKISQFHYQVGYIINKVQGNKYDEYLNRAGIQVR